MARWIEQVESGDCSDAHFEKLAELLEQQGNQPGMQKLVQAGAKLVICPSLAHPHTSVTQASQNPPF